MSRRCECGQYPDVCARYGHREPVCGAYFGERDDSALHGTHGAVCIRPAGHPEVQEDGIGHSSSVVS